MRLRFVNEVFTPIEVIAALPRSYYYSVEPFEAMSYDGVLFTCKTLYAYSFGIGCYSDDYRNYELMGRDADRNVRSSELIEDELPEMVVLTDSARSTCETIL